MEVSTDGGQTYAESEIHQPGTKISWSLWRYAWTPTEPAEEVRVFVRAINGEGERQIEEFRDQVPHGALGLHWVRGRVVADLPTVKWTRGCATTEHNRHEHYTEQARQAIRRRV